MSKFREAEVPGRDARVSGVRARPSAPPRASAMAPPPPVVAAQPQSTSKTINIKILGVCAILLLAAMIYNSMGGGARFSYHGGRGAAVHEAALPLQKRPRKSKYDHGADPDSPDEVVVPGAAGSTAPSKAAAAALMVAVLSPPPPAALPFAKQVDSNAYALAAESMEGYSCHAREGYDLAGDAAYVWGLAFNVASAAECCAACAAQRQICGQTGSRGKPFWRASRRERTQGRCSGAPGVCNAWVFCPGSDDTVGANDRCFSYTIHNHSQGECW